MGVHRDIDRWIHAQRHVCTYALAWMWKGSAGGVTTVKIYLSLCIFIVIHHPPSPSSACVCVRVWSRLCAKPRREWMVPHLSPYSPGAGWKAGWGEKSRYAGWPWLKKSSLALLGLWPRAAWRPPCAVLLCRPADTNAGARTLWRDRLIHNSSSFSALLSSTAVQELRQNELRERRSASGCAMCHTNNTQGVGTRRMGGGGDVKDNVRRQVAEKRD